MSYMIYNILYFLSYILFIMSYMIYIIYLTQYMKNILISICNQHLKNQQRFITHIFFSKLSLRNPGCFYTHSTSQFGFAMFCVLRSHVWSYSIGQSSSREQWLHRGELGSSLAFQSEWLGEGFAAERAAILQALCQGLLALSGKDIPCPLSKVLG